MKARARLLLPLAALPGVGRLAAAAPPLRLGGYEVAPLMLGEDHRPLRGALPAFLRQEVAPRLPFALEFLPPMSFGRALRGLHEGDHDILLLISGTPQETPGVGRFPWSMLQVRPSLALRADSTLQLKASGLAALRGLHIAWNAHSEPPAELQGLGIRWQATSGTRWQQANMRMLKAGRVDAAFFYNPLSPRYWARREHFGIRVLELPLAPMALEMGYSRLADSARVQAFGRACEKAFRGPAFRRAVEQYRD